MARRGSRGDRVLESRHLIGLFVGVVILCAVFFTLGFVMGRAHYSASVQAYGVDRGVMSAVDREPGHETDREEAPRERAQPKEEPPPPAPAGEWDFYANQSNNKLEKPAPAPPPAPKAAEKQRPLVAANRPVETPAMIPATAAPRAAATRPVRMTAPKIAGGHIVLQLAAVTHQGDAMAMAEALQRKRFPSYVVPPSGDPYYRVQVGPYPDERAAENARMALDRAGFKAIIKH